MAEQSSGMFVWSWTEVSVLGSQVFEQAFTESFVVWTHLERGGLNDCNKKKLTKYSLTLLGLLKTQ